MDKEACPQGVVNTDCLVVEYENEDIAKLKA